MSQVIEFKSNKQLYLVESDKAVPAIAVSVEGEEVHAHKFGGIIRTYKVGEVGICDPHKEDSDVIIHGIQDILSMRQS